MLVAVHWSLVLHIHLIDRDVAAGRKRFRFAADEETALTGEDERLFTFIRAFGLGDHSRRRCDREDHKKGMGQTSHVCLREYSAKKYIGMRTELGALSAAFKASAATDN